MRKVLFGAGTLAIVLSMFAIAMAFQTKEVKGSTAHQRLSFTKGKVCRSVLAGRWSDSLLVSDDFAPDACKRHSLEVTGVNPSTYYLGCESNNGIYYGAENGGKPNPNCGW